MVIISPKLGFAFLSSRASQTDPWDPEQDIGTTAGGGERLDDVHLSFIIEKIRAETKVGVTNKRMLGNELLTSYLEGRHSAVKLQVMG